MNDGKKKVQIFARELSELMRKHHISSIGVTIDGDTHGITSSFVIEDANRKEFVVDVYSDYATANSLLEFSEEQ